MFRESKLFTVTAVAALALGIGVNVAVFSVANAVLLKPVPFAEPDRLVTLMLSSNRQPLIPASSPAQFVYWQDLRGVFEAIAAYRNVFLNFAGADTPERLAAARVSEAYFRVLRAPMASGRSFTPEEDLPGGGSVAIVSHDFWQRRLASDPEIVGKTILLDGSAHTVVGVTGRELDFRELGSPEVWVPLQTDPATTDHPYLYQVVARLARGVSLADAQERLEASVAAFRERFPGVLGPRGGFSALPMEAAPVGRTARTMLALLLGAVSLVLLIACANVANLLLVRAAGRRREIAIRSALGASRLRIVRQLVAESGLLSLAGGALGLLAGFAGMRALLAVNTAGLPRLGEAGVLATLDWRVVAFTIAMALVTTMLFGLAPALVGSRVDLVQVIKGGSRASGDRWSGRLRSTLVIVEIALAVVLLIGAGLLIRASLALQQVDTGFDPRNLLTAQTSLTGPAFQTAAGIEEAIRLGRERVSAIPGVLHVAAGSSVPMKPGWGMPFNVIGREDAGLYTGSNAVVFGSQGYFETLGVPVVRGRGFDTSDGSGGPPVVVINETLARRHWPDGADPLNDRMVIGGGAQNMREYAAEPPREIVGIVADVRATDLASDPEPMMYVPQAQLPDALAGLAAASLPMVWLVRTEGDPSALAATIRRELETAMGVPVTDVRTMEQLVWFSVSRQRLHTLLMSVFGAAALLLAAIGIYGVVAYAAEQRRHELGIRSALGAEPHRLRASVLRHGVVLIALGLGGGIIGAFYLADLLAAFLFGVAPRDTVVFACVPAALTTVALAVVWSVAQGASRVDPLETLRQE